MVVFVLIVLQWEWLNYQWLLLTRLKQFFAQFDLAMCSHFSLFFVFLFLRISPILKSIISIGVTAIFVDINQLETRINANSDKTIRKGCFAIADHKIEFVSYALYLILHVRRSISWPLLSQKHSYTWEVLWPTSTLIWYKWTEETGFEQTDNTPFRVI